MKRTPFPITIATVVAGLALGAAGGAIAAAGADKHKSVQARCEQRAAVRTEPREAFKAERQKENVFRLQPSKRQEIARPILDEAVKEGTLPAKARDRVLSRLGRATPPGRP